MRALFLDDWKDRHDTFDLQFADDFDEVIHVWNYDECVEALRKYDFDMLFLDHDLCDEAVMCNPDTAKFLTGTDVAIVAVQMLDPVFGPCVIIHSMNPIGAEKMHSVFMDAGFYVKRVPFHMLSRYVLSNTSR